MNRRNILLALAGLPFAPPALAALPWAARFLGGGFDGESYVAGLYVQIDKGWKTYWRNPGDAGIPPTITATADNFASLTVDFPLPKRFVDAGGEALGYHDEVLFPLHLKPKDPSKPMSVHFSSFFGVCQQVCTPAKFEAMLSFTPKDAPSTEAGLISKWQARVPSGSTFASSAQVNDSFLVIKINQPCNDIFVEGPDRYYFRAPDFAREAGKAFFKIDGLKNPDDLHGVELRLTADANGQGLEQRITLA